jgi:predicted metal-dependent phosphoesterase TrpH
MAFLKFDLHTHSSNSPDSLMRPEKMREIGIARGLSGAAITDHSFFTSVPKGLSDEKFVFIPAEEVKTTDRGDLIGLFLKKEVKRLPFAAASELIRKQGGLAVAPHPFDSLGRDSLRPKPEDAGSLDAMETANGRAPKKANREALRFAHANQLPSTGGSDAHFYSEIGNAYTIVQMDPRLSPERKMTELRKSILAGKTAGVLERSAPIHTRLLTSFTKLRKKIF